MICIYGVFKKVFARELEEFDYLAKAWYPLSLNSK
jgi:hypothetical protein